MTTYSFVDVMASMAGPGGVVSMGQGAAVAGEGITIERAEDKDNMVVGADGQIMHVLRAGRHGTVLVRLLKTSPTNAVLQAMYDFQSLTSANWGQNVIVVSQTVAGDIATARSAAFRRAPALTYNTDGALNEWPFNAGFIDAVLGVYPG